MQTGVTDGLKGFILVTEELEMKTKVNTKLSSGGKPGGPHVAPSRNDLPKNDQRKPGPPEGSTGKTTEQTRVAM